MSTFLRAVYASEYRVFFWLFQFNHPPNGARYLVRFMSDVKNRTGISIIFISRLIAVYSVLWWNNVMNNFIACSQLYKNWLDCVIYRSEGLSSIFICLIFYVEIPMSNFLCRIFYVQIFILLCEFAGVFISEKNYCLQL